MPKVGGFVQNPKRSFRFLYKLLELSSTRKVYARYTDGTRKAIADFPLPRTVPVGTDNPHTKGIRMAYRRSFCIFANHTLAKYMMNTHKTNTQSALRTDRLKAAKPRFTDATDKLHAFWLAPSSRGVVLQYEFRCRLYKRTLKMNLFQN